MSKTMQLIHAVSGATLTLEISAHSWVWEGDEDRWIGGVTAGKNYLACLIRQGWVAA